MLIMTSIIRVGQSKFVSVQIDEVSNERIMNCIQTLSELKTEPIVHEVFLDNTKAAFSKRLGAQEVCLPTFTRQNVDDFCRNVPLKRRKLRRRRRLLFRLMIC